MARVNFAGVINTELCDDMAELKGVGKKDMMAALAAKHPLGHVSEPWEVASTIVFLASKAAFITGASLPVDGGATLG